GSCPVSARSVATVKNGITMDRLRSDGRRFMEEISREHYLASSGNKDQAELQPIYAKYRHIMDADSLAMVLERFKETKPGTEDRRWGGLLLEWQAEAQSARELAALDEREMAWESSAVMTLSDGSKMQYEQAAIEIGNATDRARRLDIEKARNKLVEN